MSLNKYVQDRNSYDNKGRIIAAKERLEKFVEGRVKTLFIGIISDFENHLGDIWGHGKIVDECDDIELDNRVVWKECRNKILDSGHDVIRVLIKELENYSVELRKHKIVFKKEGEK